MMEARLIFMAIVCLCIAQLAFANTTESTLKSFQDQQRYVSILKQTRCMVCQNQSLFESNSALADKMRSQITAKLNAGATDAEVYSFLRAEYGEEITYMPAWQSTTYALWLAPLTVLGAAFLLVRRYVRTHAATGYSTC